MVAIEQYFKKSELLPAIVQEKDTGEVLMLAYMNQRVWKKPWKQDIPGFLAVRDRNYGTKERLPDMYKK